jgi:protein-S-isoprenylcysteine O-methyltransferase Ste14
MRINILRLLFAACVPLILFSRPVIDFEGFFGEIVEQTGVFLIIAAVLGRFWSILYSGGAKNARVVQEGPYSICRHPLYLFSTIGVIGFGLMLGSLIVTVVVGGLTAMVLSITAKKEEAYLRQAFGPAYDAYAARVPMIAPRLSGFTTPEEITVSLGPLRRNLFDALVFLGFIPLAELLEGIKSSGWVPTFPLF